MPMQFPGMSYPTSVSAVVLRGPAPSRILAEAIYEPQYGAGYGDLAFTNGNQGIAFYQSAACSYHLRHGLDRHDRIIVSATFLDRRWKWKFSQCTARFNERLPNNSIKYSTKHPGYRRSARDIFAAILASLADGGADVSQAPGNVYPRCFWQNVPADEALRELCRLTHCTIVLTSANQIRVVALGVGIPLSNTPDKKAVNSGFRLGAVPAGVAIGCGPSIFQSKLLLEAVGLDYDGRIRPIDELSYKPDGGWAREEPFFFPNVDQSKRHLACQTVWRWYRVKGQVNGSLPVPGTSYPVVSADQYRLTPWLVEVGDNGGMPCHLPARVYGEYFPQQDFPENTPKKANVPSAFRILPELGIVEFPFPIWKEGTGNYAGDYVEPKLYLETGYHLADAQGFGLECYRPRSATGFGTFTNDWTLPHPELWEAHVVQYGSDGVQIAGSTNNLGTVNAEAGEYLARAVTAIRNVEYSTDMIFGGIAGYDLDGIRSQALIEYGDEVTPSTRVSQGIESDIFTHDQRIRGLYE